MNIPQAKHLPFAIHASPQIRARDAPKKSKRAGPDEESGALSPCCLTLRCDQRPVLAALASPRADPPREAPPLLPPEREPLPLQNFLTWASTTGVNCPR